MPEENDFLHDWLYSVLPITPTYTEYTNDANVHFNNIPNDWLVLSGFCRFCRRVFSVRVPVASTGDLLITQTEVPKNGCVDRTQPSKPAVLQQDVPFNPPAPPKFASKIVREP